MSSKQYWCYRIDTSRASFFQKNLENGILRQGWGSDKKQDLRNLTLEGGAKRNRPMFDRVKKGDILLIPRLPESANVTIAEATEDWNKGYNFEISQEFGDYGHQFPAKILKTFVRTNSNVSGGIRATLKNVSRFWNINQYCQDVEKLILAVDTVSSQNHQDRFLASIEDVFQEIFQEASFKEKIYNKLTSNFSNEEWEFALVEGLSNLYPEYTVERVGGKTEKQHGTDILIRIPGLSTYQYGIAIQVKDYEGFVSDEVISQINKADKYWLENESLKLIDKIVIITKADKGSNLKLANKDSSVNFIFAEELKELLGKIAKNQIGIK